jgi:uncharacterized repeat protein (TIGR02059 family)
MRTAFIIILLTINAAVSATTYYIDPLGKDSNNGSSSSPWRTLAYACSKVTTKGDIIHVNSGTYTETVQSILAVGVSIEGEGIKSNIISNITSGYMIYLNSVNEGTNGNQHISKINMDGNSLTSPSAIIINARSNVKIYDCTFQNFGTSGVVFNGGAGYLSDAPKIYATGNEFHDNIISNCARYEYGTDNAFGCINIGAQEGMLVYNNNINQTQRAKGYNGYPIKFYSYGHNKGLKIYNNSLTAAPLMGTGYMFAIEMWNSEGGLEINNNVIYGCIDLVKPIKGTYSRGVDIHHNLIGWDNLMPAVDGEGEVGIHVEYSFSNLYIHNNHFRNLSMPLFVSSTTGYTLKDLYFYSNIVENVGTTNVNYKGWGIRMSANDNTCISDNWNIINNVFTGNTSGGLTAYGIQIPEGIVSNITIRNNTIQGFSVSPVFKNNTPSAANNVSIENNIFFENGNNNNPSGSATFANYVLDKNLKDNPLFVSSADFHLQSGSPAIGKGLKISWITSDYDGNAINDPPSIGPFEYYSAPEPVYQSSVIENSSPAMLEMTYSINLANIIPANSAFSVQVNSVVRNINSVAIVGNKVRLTLSSGVVYGDVVKVSYTKPSTNILQSASGVEAASISAKSVNNNCLSVSPLYLSSVVEDATPSLIEMTYNLNLANIVPAGSSFNVLVNSIVRTTNSVSISGNKVRLNLASAIKYGDIVTVSYTKPVINPLQSTTLIVASNILNKSVINNCKDLTKPNEPPEVVINYEPGSYSGFVGLIDATDTHDADNDVLTFEWIVPDSLSVSSKTDSKIQFLAPIVYTPKIIELQLKVSDGINLTSKSIQINILPYKPELEPARIADIEAVSYDATYYPQNVIDGDFETIWSSAGDNQWLFLNLEGSFKISYIEIAFLKGQKYSSFFDIYTSQDNLVWVPILTNVVSCNFSGDSQVFDYPLSLSNTECSFIKFIGHGNSHDDLNNISEFKIFGAPGSNSGSPFPGKNKIIIYPNPAPDYFNILFEEKFINPDLVRIIDLSGKVVFEDLIEGNIITVQIPPAIKSGIYIVELKSGSLTIFAQQLVVKR